MIVLLITVTVNVCYSQWVQAFDPLGAVTCFAVSGTNLYAAAPRRSGGLLCFSAGSGMSWVAYPAPFLYFGVAVSPNGAGGANLFAGTWGGGMTDGKSVSKKSSLP